MQDFFCRFLYQNLSILNIAFSSILLFQLSIISLSKKILWAKLLAKFLNLFLLTLIIYTNGRAGWIGLIAGSYFLSKKVFPQLKLSRIATLVTAFFLILLFVFFIWFKKDSSHGRLLIYKISANIFHDNWLSGIGIGKFKEQYNLYQANYFSANSIDSKESLLADNTFYAFNDLWQLLIEVGVIGFTGFLIAAIFLFRYLKQYKIKPGKSYLFYGASSALLCIIVASLFSYPFHVFGIQVLSFIFVVIMLSSIESSDKSNRCKHWFLLSSKALCFAGLFYLCFYGYNKIMLLKKSKEAFQLSQSGFKNESLSAYSSLQKSFAKDETFLYAYAKQLYNSNRLAEAKNVLAEAKQYYTENELYKLSAAINYEQGNFKEAEKDYLMAMYMVPNRMISRYELYNFYLSIKDTTKAIRWAQSILSMPVKIPSERTATIQKMVKDDL